MKTAIAIISRSAILACLTLVAQEEFPVAQFKQMDQDGNGFVTLEEIKSFFASGRQKQSGPAQNPAALQAGGVPMKTVLDLRYATLEGVEPKLTSLDVYAPPSATSAPILVWVHGGGWARGDKAQVASLPAAFVRDGFVVASVNYRLVPGVKFDAQAQDVAAAVAWIRKHAKDYGAAPEKIHLMSHSAGAHLVALVGTDESYRAAHGLSLSALPGVVPLDTEAYGATRSRRSAQRPHRLRFAVPGRPWPRRVLRRLRRCPWSAPRHGVDLQRRVACRTKRSNAHRRTLTPIRPY